MSRGDDGVNSPIGEVAGEKRKKEEMDVGCFWWTGFWQSKAAKLLPRLLHGTTWPKPQIDSAGHGLVAAGGWGEPGGGEACAVRVAERAYQPRCRPAACR